jgi:imidazoleglycerol phosphate synthase glutamine amidotransferase subunit HisH
MDPIACAGSREALRRAGFEHVVARQPEEARHCRVVLLAAGTSFQAGQAWLREHGWWRELHSLISDGVHVLALDTAMHLLAEGSEDAPRNTGLGLLPGLARRLGPGVKVPHLGWARTRLLQSSSEFPDPKGEWLYYGHTFALDPTDETWWISEHGRPFAALLARGRVAGVQARLARSGSFGAVALQALLAWMGERPRQVSDPSLN